jgi:osmotically-inducible protein OsmY
MTHTAWNMSGNYPASGVGRCMSAFVFFALLLLAFPGGTQAAEEQSGPFLLTSSTQTMKEIEIETRIRRALRQDAQLRSLNLAVYMSGGVATLSGPVPAAELKQRAIRIVQGVEGVLTVSAKDLYVSTSEQDGKRLAVVIQDDQPTQTRSASPGSLSLGGGWRVEGGGSNSPPSGSQQIALQAPETAAPIAPALPSTKLGQGGVGGTHLTANPHPASPAASISLAVEQLRRRETRYQQIRARVQGTTVFVFSGEATSEDAMTFAQAVRRLPGVQHVILSSGPR